MIKKIIVLSTLFFLSSCGRYVDPVSPEIVAPEGVRALAVDADLTRVTFNFRSAQRDTRGKQLKSLDGYRIYKKEITEESPSIFKKDEYDLLTMINDDHLPELFALQDQARAEGRSPRRVRAPDAQTTFTFTDKNITPDRIFAYRIVGVNQNGVESNMERIVKVDLLDSEVEVQIIR